MRAGAMWAVALTAVAGLAALVITTARSGASGSPAGALLAATAGPPAKQVEAADLRGCTLETKHGGNVTIAGACVGRLPARLGCVASDEIATLTAQVRSHRGRIFTLSILMPRFTEVGDYPGQVFAQLSDLGGAPRWSARNVPIRASEDSLAFDSIPLEPEPGTPATGTLTLAGSTRAPCVFGQ